MKKRKQFDTKIIIVQHLQWTNVASCITINSIQICESYHGVRQLIPSMKKMSFRVVAAYGRGGDSGVSGHIYDK